MRPCQNCGVPIENSQEFCESCSELSLPSKEERAASFEKDYRKRRREEAAQNSDTRPKAGDDAQTRAESQLIIAAIAIPLILMFTIAVLFGMRYGITGFFFTTMIESLVVLVVMRITSEAFYTASSFFNLIVVAVFVISLMLLIYFSPSSFRAQPAVHGPIFQRFANAV